MERDNSFFEILRRYEKANLQAIAMHDRIAFDSLRDVFYLVNKCKKLESELAALRSTNQSVETKEKQDE